MRNNILLLLFLIYGNCTFSQLDPGIKSPLKMDHMTKSKRQKTAAWIMAVGGVITATTGIAVAASGALDNMGPETDKHQTLADILFISGTASTLGSIPLFIASGRNKKKSKEIGVKWQPTILNNKHDIVFKIIPAITLKLCL